MCEVQELTLAPVFRMPWASIGMFSRENRELGLVEMNALSSVGDERSCGRKVTHDSHLYYLSHIFPFT